ncbi:hypothetical protein M413DRAFT_370843 [Hebeloma cylindrosporum]|uniref:Manganese lipoxygenase n=1 Tax=Hebeloma cylindrosporum TaxID=76867 RepID=A0A0C3CJG0_HEBCY|nr:hypothetical protein M413DRAFT_370843 [Hebeloma cylindrosporum h7]
MNRYTLESKYAIGAGQGQQGDIVIAVMGSTGTGKSSFVKLLTGDKGVKVGDTLESETSEVKVVRFLDPLSGRKITIVDTPGFDDSRADVSDTDTLRIITNFLLDEYDKDRKLNSLVYFHRISDPRFSAQSGRNLRMFRGLCGKAAFKNVIALTTFWDQVSVDEGDKREAQLKSNFFKDLVAGGAQFIRHDRTIESARQVLRRIFTLAPAITQIQREIREDGNSLEDTAAGSVLREEVERVIAKYREEVADLKSEIVTVTKRGEAVRQQLVEERATLQQELARWERERSELKKGLGEAKESSKRLEAETSKLQAQLVGMKARQGSARDNSEIGAMESPPPYQEGRSAQSIVQILFPSEKFQFNHSDKYPPYLKRIPPKYQTGALGIFDFTSLLQTTAMLSFQPGTLSRIRNLAPEFSTTRSMEDLVNRNHELHTKSQQSDSVRDMYFAKNIGHRDDWYTDAAFGQQQLTGTNPTTITLAPLRWITEFKTASRTQQRADVTSLLTDYPQSLFVQDYSDFRSSMGLSPSDEFVSEGRYACSSVALFHLEPEGKLHPLAITLDYKGSMEDSVTIFNRRITSITPGDEETDWPWRYAKMCVQVSDWLRHEVAVHLVNTHLVEEVIIVAANRTFEPHHIVFQLLEPHWNTTLSLNKAAREVLVPKIIIGMTGFTATQTYAFLKEAYYQFEWTDSYVPNDLRRRGFPIEDLDKVKYHNCGYARNIARMWEILRNFVSMVLTEAYASDAQVANDRFISAFCNEARSHSLGQLASLPDIETLDELIDFVTMCIHIASPQHTAVNYLQQYYQTFVPNKPSALYTRLPESLAQLQDFGEEDMLMALPIHEPRDWLLMAQVPYLLSFEVPDDTNILHYATTISDSSSTPSIIRDAALVLKEDLEAFIGTVAQYSQELDDQQTPYLVLDPSKTAVSILI